ncbi:MAG TPA: tripartite tricarboxylate transporter substrate-binding protein [Beijerinckiaceae bacterium]|jgi:tripartite-type tricarboxylate transporter receptor subunit TctC
MAFALRMFAALLACLAHAGVAVAQDEVEAFYKGRQVTMLVGSAAGSGYDLNARLLARHLANHIPGKPVIVVQNQPGAGSVVMVNSLYNTAPRDGSVMGAAINGAPTAPLLTPKAARFDPTKLNWIGSTNRDTQVFYVWHTSPIHKLEDVKTTEIVVGATNPGTTQVDFPKVAADILGLKFKLVSGYKGTHEIHLAMERGEVQGMGSNGWLALKVLNSDWLRDNKVRLIAVFNEEPDPELKDVPTVFSLARTEEDRQALRLMVARLEYGRPFFLPPDVPQQRVDALRRAFDATMRDPAYLAEAEKMKIDVDPLSGEKVAELIRRVLATPPAVAGRVAAALEGAR